MGRNFLLLFILTCKDDLKHLFDVFSMLQEKKKEKKKPKQLKPHFFFFFLISRLTFSQQIKRNSLSFIVWWEL